MVDRPCRGRLDPIQSSKIDNMLEDVTQWIIMMYNFFFFFQHESVVFYIVCFTPITWPLVVLIYISPWQSKRHTYHSFEWHMWHFDCWGKSAETQSYIFAAHYAHKYGLVCITLLSGYWLVYHALDGLTIPLCGGVITLCHVLTCLWQCQCHCPNGLCHHTGPPYISRFPDVISTPIYSVSLLYALLYWPSVVFTR